DLDETMIYCLTGQNAGKSKKCTSTSGTTATFVVAWPLDVAAGDTFMTGGCVPTQTLALTLTSDLTGVNGALAPTGAAYNVVELRFKDRSSSYAYITFGDHAFCTRPT
ncbi:MAG: hypothetical protein NUW01_01325, partial [Gemmatimonadaceae bacterium]|nr:hypothetical protein [Gemmatimonadaceae bacterium]